MNSGQITQAISDLNNEISMMQNNVNHDIDTMWTVFAIFIAVIALFVSVGMPIILKSMVNVRIDKELEDRIQTIMEKNPPIFNLSRSEVPNKDQRIYLDKKARGIDQIDPETVISLTSSYEKPNILNSTNIEPFLIIDENGNPYLQFYGYTGGKINYHIIWPRIKFTK